MSLVQLSDIRLAATRIQSIARRTPVLDVSDIAGRPLWLKCEPQQPGGAFKIRGATNMLKRLDAEALKRGVITFSSGNHGQAVALAAQRLGAPAVIVMPTTAPAIKVAGVKRWGAEVTPARRRMARVPVGGDLVKNPVAGPPGFTIGNVFTLAGVPQVMRGMLEDVGPRMRGGRPTVSRTVRVEGSGEGVIAAPLEAVARAHPDMSLGSYPFFGADGYGSHLVVRSCDADALAGAVGELIAALRSAGIENVREIEVA